MRFPIFLFVSCWTSISSIRFLNSAPTLMPSFTPIPTLSSNSTLVSSLSLNQKQYACVVSTVTVSWSTELCQAISLYLTENGNLNTSNYFLIASNIGIGVSTVSWSPPAHFCPRANNSIAVMCDLCDGGSTTTYFTESFLLIESCVSPCPTGSYSQSCSESDIASCLCNSSSCRMCPAGTASSTKSSISKDTCVACGVGQVSAEGSTNCTSCAAGRYATDDPHDNDGGQTKQVLSGSVSCNPCPRGFFSSDESSIVCQSCEIGRNSELGSTECDIAAIGYYISPTSEEADGSPLIKQCPANGKCMGSNLLPMPEKGSWVDRRDIDFVSTMYTCPWDTCSGGTLANWTNTSQAVESCWIAASFSNEESKKQCDDDLLMCTEGAAGPLCGYCIQGYTFSYEYNHCISCVQAGIVSFIFLGVGLFVAACVVAVKLGFIILPDRVWAFLMSSRILGTLLEIDSGVLRVVWSTYQIIESVSYNVGARYPWPFTVFAKIFTIFSFDFLSLDCMTNTSSEFTYVILWSMGPIVLVALTFVAYLVRIQGRLKPEKRVIRRQHAFVFLMLAYLVLPTVTRAQLQALDCIEVAGRRYLRIDTSVSCDTQKYYDFLVADALFILVYLSVPLIWLAWLFKKAPRLNPPTEDQGLVQYLRDRDPSLLPLELLFGVYRPTMYYFEVIEMYRRIVFVGVLPLISSKNARRAAFGIFLSICSAVAYREIEPFFQAPTNVLVHIAQYTILVTFGAALVLNTSLQHNLGGHKLGFVLLLVNLIVILVAVIIGARRFIGQERKRKRQQESVALTVEASLDADILKLVDLLNEINRNAVPRSHCLVYWYSSEENARAALQIGIPVLEMHRNGIIFSFNRPHEFDDFDSRFYPSNEAVLAVIVPSRLLSRLPSELEGSSKHRILSGDILKALRFPPNQESSGSYFTNKFVYLPPRLIVRALQNNWRKAAATKSAQITSQMPSVLIEDHEHSRNNQMIGLGVAPFKIPTPTHLGDFIADFSTLIKTCASNNWIPVFHYTQPFLAASILDSGLRMTNNNQNHGGVLFSLCSPASYQIGTKNYERNLILDLFGESMIQDYMGKRRLSLIVVYGMEPSALKQAPGRNDNIKVVSKDMFEALALPNAHGDYFLRPDRILGIFQIDPRSPPKGYREMRSALAREMERDQTNKSVVAGVLQEANENEKDINEVRHGTWNSDIKFV